MTSVSSTLPSTLALSPIPTLILPKATGSLPHPDFLLAAGHSSRKRSMLCMPTHTPHIPFLPHTPPSTAQIRVLISSYFLPRSSRHTTIQFLVLICTPFPKCEMQTRTWTHASVSVTKSPAASHSPVRPSSPNLSLSLVPTGLSSQGNTSNMHRSPPQDALAVSNRVLRMAETYWVLCFSKANLSSLMAPLRAWVSR